MNRFLSIALASASVLALGSTAKAQPQAAAPAAASADEATLGEIVVTARRRSESLQEVPQTVNAVTADSLQKLNIKQFQDVQYVVPGLSLSSTSQGYSSSASLRGVTYDVSSGAQPTVALYLNDAPVQANSLFQSLFDIGQVEVLKGPQGTTRGISAPSGAITVTTHQPDLSEFGGYADVTLTDIHGRNAQAAINLPLIKDVLALRVAGVVDSSNYDGVTSIHNNLQPRSLTSAERYSLSFEPSDIFNATVVYQHLDTHVTSFQQVSGRGSGAFTNAAGAFSASVNPPLSPTDRLSVQDGPNDTRVHYDTVTGQVDSRILGQHLSYVGSYQHQSLDNINVGAGSAQGDVGNILPGVEISGHTRTAQVATSQEVRLASEPAPGRFFDYTVGGFYQWQDNTGHVDQPGPLLPGAFGPPPKVNLALFNPAYMIPVGIDTPSTLQETSLFGSVTFHLGANTELTGGIRHIWSVVSNQTLIMTENGQAAVSAALFGGNCAAAHLASTYPGFCDRPVAGGRVVSNLTEHTSETPNIYNVSLSHHFTRDFLVYANTGTAYRPPVASVGIQGALANSSNPALSTLSFHPSERSRSYEVGFKSTWFDGRGRLNASIFRQRFTNLVLVFPGITYSNTVSTPAQPTNFNFTQSVDALVQGFDVDAAFQVTPDWNISVQTSYADAKVQGSLVPCNIFGANGQPVFNTDNLISLCPGAAASRLPLWNATFQSEYTHPVADNMDGFFRLLATYYPDNNRAEPNFVVDAYSLVNLYLGVRSHDGAWEASIFARNAFNAQRALDVSTAQANLNSALGQSFAQLVHPSGYYQTLQTPQRAVGINVHYSWGSR